jgi:serine/threonine-protein kinase HipA
MAKKITLHIYLNTRYVGELIQNTSGAISFKYASEWISQFPDYGISMSLPVQESEYKGDEVFFYFDNLLPDNDQIRKTIAEKVQAKSHRTFDLLNSVGRDCVGALRFLSNKIEIKNLSPIKGKELKSKDIAQIIGDLKSFPLGMKESEFRLSIAGAQEKTALLKINHSWYRPEDETPTTHILKPPMGQLQNGIDLNTSVENEWLCLKLCEYFGLEVAQASIEMFIDKKCLVVERFDRHWVEKDKIARIAQEDLCQALKYPSTKKYESDGGPSIKEIMHFLSASLEREKDQYDFMKSQILFWLMGATDGHAKNYSIFIRPNGYMLTPFYDVMSMYPALESKQVNLREMKLSFKLGKSRYDRIDKLKLRHFYETAQISGYSSQLMDKLLIDLKEKTIDGFMNFINLPKDFPKNISDSILINTFNSLKKLQSISQS